MHAPNSATQIQSASRPGFFAGVCQSGCPSNLDQGWFVPYRRVKKYTDAYEAVINLCVQDLSSTSLIALPFIIDTGTDVTIIPRQLLTHDAFPRSKSIGSYSVMGLTGGHVVGLRFRAAVFINPHKSGLNPLSFGELHPVVVDDWAEDYGMLGLDALRKVVMVSDDEHISLWPKPANPCLATAHHS